MQKRGKKATFKVESSKGVARGQQGDSKGIASRKEAERFDEAYIDAYYNSHRQWTINKREFIIVEKKWIICLLVNTKQREGTSKVRPRHSEAIQRVGF